MGYSGVAWSAVALLVTAVLAVGVWLCIVFQTAVTPVLLAVLGTALLGPMHRRLVRMKMNRSLAAALTCLAVVAVVGGATYIVVLAPSSPSPTGAGSSGCGRWAWCSWSR